MKIIEVSSPNFSPTPISVEFLVLHYTGCTLEETLRIFTSRETKVCAHFVIDADGTLYDLGGSPGPGFWSAPITKGAHAGESRFTDPSSKTWEAFNQFSVGVELVNLNGNLFDYTDKQYSALSLLTKRLRARFPALGDPSRVVGHEHIAGFRGKVDPGSHFDWERFYENSYETSGHPKRPHLMTSRLMKEFEKLHGKIHSELMTPEDWPKLSSQIEAFAKNALAAKTRKQSRS